VARKFTIQYRQLKTVGLWDGVDLKAMLVDVLRRQQRGQVIAENAKLRIIDLDQDQSFVILNKLSNPATWMVQCSQANSFTCRRVRRFKRSCSPWKRTRPSSSFKI